MYNNKGQSLVLFVIVLPVLLFILILVIDIGKVIVLKQELDNINEIVLDYGLDKLNSFSLDKNQIDNLDNTDLDDGKMDNDVNDDEINFSYIESELVNLVKLNKDDIDMINIRIEDNKIYINLYDKTDGIFSRLMDMSIFSVKSFYVGYMDSDDKRIERVRGD